MSYPAQAEGLGKYDNSYIKISNLVKEILGRAVSDSAYSQTIAGEIWFNIFFDTLSDRYKQLVETADIIKNDLLIHKSTKTAGMLLNF